MLNASVARALEAWLQLVRKRRKMATSVARMLQSSLVFAFFEWLTYAELRSAALVKLRKALLRISKGGVRRAFGSWLAWVETLQERQLKMRGFTVRLLHAGLGRAWATWLELVETHRRMRGFVARILNQGLARAWQQWLEWCESNECLLAGKEIKAVEPGVPMCGSAQCDKLLLLRV